MIRPNKYVARLFIRSEPSVMEIVDSPDKGWCVCQYSGLTDHRKSQLNKYKERRNI